MSTNHVTPAGGNIFADLNIPDAENEKLRLSLLAAIREWASGSGLTQTEAAAAMGIKQPTLNDAIKGRYHKFTIDRPVRIRARAAASPARQRRERFRRFSAARRVPAGEGTRAGSGFVLPASGCRREGGCPHSRWRVCVGREYPA